MKSGMHWARLISFFAPGVTYCRNCRSVMVQPGETTLTRIRRGPNSRASERVNPITPPLVPTYALISEGALWNVTEARFTMDPPGAFIHRTDAWLARK